MSMITNDPSVVDSDAFTVRRTITIAAPPEKVWAAVTQAEHIARWFPQAAVLDELAVGAGGTFTFNGYGAFPVRIEELDPPHVVAYRWGNDNTHAVPIHPDRSTVFRFTLEPVDGGTRLTVVESGFETLTDPGASMESNRGGWDAELDELVAYLEGGS
ncbi:Activator of Hsp90 ATPase 1 family protein [Xylanimonas cellulosilytica DSM 15894]|uniref:Activator of Hsp90 ATPase 1 family protein n=1 Tax=Xylanimonas cellulosilytica (strain DSM 15894 / JCM 12276 / CECT 5975 / KCTC 9989 / LMG 20990 / NBRC 107835 / XIL07) TaxID=446471 RepID=D1BT44_XYLCX|nr:SRPBCC family protein [Xylanimonas cellulosilytica]ACZ30886.1 Activator of Hsp90 ATPase 1 family protein [Xylanimonas cellulosilytica DSM 15894]